MYTYNNRCKKQPICECVGRWVFAQWVQSCSTSLTNTLYLNPSTCGVAYVSSEMLAQLSRISHTLSVIFPGCPDEQIGQTVIKLHTDTLLSPELHIKVCIGKVHSFLLSCFKIVYLAVSVGCMYMFYLMYCISASHRQVVNMILRNFCQCMLDASRANPPNKWVKVLEITRKKELIIDRNWKVEKLLTNTRPSTCSTYSTTHDLEQASKWLN